MQTTAVAACNSIKISTWSQGSPGRTYGPPAVCPLAQGGKELRLGEEHVRYDPDYYLVATAGVFMRRCHHCLQPPRARSHQTRRRS
jgi:hypothetical protein